MLELNNITKDYFVGTTAVNALKGINIKFRNSEFVSVLGPSGCGKTTLLNIIGGLDQYTDGDLIIGGKSTKEFKDRDWDNYRNHKVGFVFQNYNLISHQTVLSNVELALTLSGVPKSVRRKKAAEALEKVGLGDQLDKKPMQMSGGQMQRVAIARALVNDPDIILADEPTGALDSATSVQIMELLKEISKDKLIIMVTHNPSLAENYSTRIIKLLDGVVTEDSAPYSGAETVKKEKETKKPSMSFFTALSLSKNNLLTKKARTFLTSFAGSIGIIGIALILSVSSGVNAYIDSVQEDTLSSYPITIEDESVDATEMMKSIMGVKNNKNTHTDDRVYSSSTMYEMLNAMNTTQTNNLEKFKKFVDDENKNFGDSLSAVKYGYDLDLSVYTENTDGKIVKSDINELITQLYGMSETQNQQMSSVKDMFGGFGNMNVWEEMLAGDNGKLHNDLLEKQYNLIYGTWPANYNDIMLIVDENNEISDLCLYALGLESSDDMKKVMDAYLNGKKVETEEKSWSYKEICGMKFKVILASDCYSYDAATKAYKDLRESEDGLDYLYNNGTELNVCGILKPNEDATSAMLGGAICYTSALTDYVIDKAYDNETVKKQLNNKTTDILTGLDFPKDNTENMSDAEKAAYFKKYLKKLSVSEKADLFVKIKSVPDDATLAAQLAQYSAMSRADIQKMIIANAGNADMDAATLESYLSAMDDEKFNEYTNKIFTESITAEYKAQTESVLNTYTDAQLSAMLDDYVSQFENADYAKLYDTYIPETFSQSTYEENLIKLGCVDVGVPKTISLYASTFADKDVITDAIEKYNENAEEKDKINYTDYVALLMSSVTTIINAITYVLIAFVAISLIVSSIMIGIITYISVLERTKEIGILRSIGASKKDISRVFNAETLIVGFISGAFGIGITLLLNMLINVILHALTGIPSLNAVLPAAGAVILIAISMLLTFIAGLIPSGIAAKKDPVTALRTE